jgi:hypothetical protein
MLYQSTRLRTAKHLHPQIALSFWFTEHVPLQNNCKAQYGNNVCNLHFSSFSWSYFLLNLRCVQGGGLGIVQCCAVGYWTPYVAWYGASYETRLAYVTKKRHAFVHFHCLVGFNVLSQVYSYMNTNQFRIQQVCKNLQVFRKLLFTSSFSSERRRWIQQIFPERHQFSTQQHSVRSKRISSFILESIHYVSFFGVLI